ncbi:MAG: nitroreductase [Alphaproteobacteria bacterium CG_4_9_14_3_um_filter_47_13]|nr:MAG: nitroreductase [Alphaproteobacteria bacterium CG_4_9_14_3_um_filter_47_13]
MSDNIIAARSSGEVLDYLLKRRSVSLKYLRDPGPDTQQINLILKAASRVPDHGKLFPWYFLVFQGKARVDIGNIIAKAYKDREPDAAPAKLILEAERFLRAPVVIAVISRIRKSRNPVWEQILSAGAVCQNLCLAANASGFGSNWITEWYAYNETVRQALGLETQDHIAGFIFIGTPAQQPEERIRPDLADITTFWTPDIDLKKGNDNEHGKQSWPETGFDFQKLL